MAGQCILLFWHYAFIRAKHILSIFIKAIAIDDAKGAKDAKDAKGRLDNLGMIYKQLRI